MTQRYGEARSSVNSGYSMYSTGSEDFQARMLALSRNTQGRNRGQDVVSPASPPSNLPMEEYFQPGLTQNNHTNDLAEDRKEIGFPSGPVDPMAMHLLLETALADSQNFTVLSPDGLDTLKKEELHISRLIDAVNKKLFIESKMDSASKSLQRLGANGRKVSGSTAPVSPRRSLLRFRSNTSTSIETVNSEPRGDGTLTKHEELLKQLSMLEKRRDDLYGKRLEHTAGVLQLNSRRQALSRLSSETDGGQKSYMNSPIYDTGEVAWPLPALDGTLDVSSHQEPVLRRLRNMNTTLHNMVSESGRQHDPPPPTGDFVTERDVEYSEHCLALVNDQHRQLLDYVQESRIQQDQAMQAQNLLANLWNKVNTGEAVLRRGSSEIRHLIAQSPSGATRREITGEEYHSEESFSAEAFPDKLQKLCDRAAAMSEEHVALNRQFLQEREDRLNSNAAKATERSKLKEQLREVHDQWRNGQKALEQSEYEVTTTKTLLEQARQDVEKYRSGLNEQLSRERNAWKLKEHDLSSRLSAKASETTLLHAALNEHEAKLSASQVSDATSVARLNEAGSAIETLGASLMAAENRLAAYQAAEMESSKNIGQIVQEKEQLESQIYRLQEELDKVSTSLASSQNRAVTHEAAASENAKQLVQRGLERKQLIIEVDNLQIELDLMDTKLQDAAGRLAQHEQWLQDSEGQNTQLASAKEGLEDEIEHLKSELAAAHATINAAETRAMTHKALAGELSNQTSTLSLEKQRTEAELSRMTHEVASLRASLEAAHRAKEAELADSDSSHQILLQQSRELFSVRDDLQDALTAKTRQYDDLALKHSDVMREMANIATRGGSNSTSQELKAALKEKQESEARARVLQKELTDLVTDYEELVRLEIEAERDRGALEETVDQLREQVQELELKASDDRVKSLGKRASNSTNGDHVNGVNGDGSASSKRKSAEGISTAVMRNEFKKMMREARADYSRTLKAEQDERRRLEGIIRDMRKEQVHPRSSALSTLSGTSQAEE